MSILFYKYIFIKKLIGVYLSFILTINIVNNHKNKKVDKLYFFHYDNE